MRLLAGAAWEWEAENWRERLERLGPLPERENLIETLLTSGLRDRRGASYPVGRK